MIVSPGRCYVCVDLARDFNSIRQGSILNNFCSQFVECIITPPFVLEG